MVLKYFRTLLKIYKFLLLRIYSYFADMLTREALLLACAALSLPGDILSDIDPFSDAIPFAINWNGPLDSAAESQVEVHVYKHPIHQIL